MNFALILAILLIIIAVIFIFKFVKSLAKAIAFSIIVILIISAGFGFYVYAQLFELQEDFINGENQVLLVDNTTVIAGFIIGENATFLDEQKLNYLTDSLEDEEYKEMQGETDKLLMLKYSTIKDKENFKIGNKDVESETVYQILESRNAHEEYTDEFGELEEVKLGNRTITDYNPEDDGVVKSIIFSNIVLNNILENKNPFYFFKLYREGQLEIHPENIAVTTMKLLPSSIFDKVTGYVG